MDRAGARRGAGIGSHYVGVFGGSFDPPHIGHVALIETALTALNLPEIWVIPAGNPVHRQLSGHASPEVRFHWLQRVFSGLPRVFVRDWEIRDNKPVSTIDTLYYIRYQFPDCYPVLLLGADAFAGMRQWVKYPEHLLLCDVAVFDRAGRPRGRWKEWKETDLVLWKEELGRGRLLYVEHALPDISATTVRRQAEVGKSLAGIVPECVCEEIERAYASQEKKE